MTAPASNSADNLSRTDDDRSPTGSRPRPLSILIIEHDSDLGLSASLPLREKGLEVAVATHRQEGVELAVRDEPDVIVLDLGPRDLDGIGVIRVLRSVPMTREIPFILLTAQELGDVERVVRGWPVVRQVLQKPVAGELLAGIIATLSGPANVR